MAVPVPALALSNALHFADPPSNTLWELENAPTRWVDAIVLTTPLWEPRTGKLFKTINLKEDVSPLVTVSINFDPDRELRISSFVVDAVSDSAKALLATSRRVRVLSTFPTKSLPALFQLTPNLTAVHLARLHQLTWSMDALASLEELQEMHATDCTDSNSVPSLASLKSLQKLNLGGCFGLSEFSALASHATLKAICLRHCSEEGGRLAQEALHGIRKCVIQTSVCELWGINKDTNPPTVPKELLPDCAAFLRSDDPEENLHGTLVIRKMVSVEGEEAPMVKVVDEGCVPFLVEQLLRDDDPELQFESAWVLTNILSTADEQTEIVVGTRNALPGLVRLLSSPSEDCRDQAAWAIGSTAGGGPTFRDKAIDCGAIPLVIEVATRTDQKQATIRNAAWALANMCRGTPPPSIDILASVLPALNKFLHHEDDEVIVDGTWALSYLTEGPRDYIQEVLNTGCMPRVVHLLGAAKSAIITPALKLITNVVGGDDHHKEAVLNSDALEQFHFLLNHPKRTIRKDVLKTLSTILAAGNAAHRQIIEKHDLFPVIVEATRSSESEVKQEALAAITATVKHGSQEELDHFIVQCNVLESLTDLLTSCSVAVTHGALEALESILKASATLSEDGSKTLAEQLFKMDGVMLVERLARDKKVAIASRAKLIIDTYLKEYAVSD